MRKPLATGAGVAAIALVAVLLAAPATFAASAVDQYSESIPTAGGPKPTRDLGQGGGSAASQNGGGSAPSQSAGGSAPTATVPPQTRSQLERTKKGSAAAKAAKLTAPNQPSASSTDTSSGMGFLLPLILAASLAVAVAVFLARRRTGAAGGPSD